MDKGIAKNLLQGKTCDKCIHIDMQDNPDWIDTCVYFFKVRKLPNERTCSFWENHIWTIRRPL